MFAFSTSRVAAAVRGRSVYHFKPFSTISYKYEDAQLKQDYEVYKSKIEHLTDKVDKGFSDMKDGFRRTDRWMMLVIGTFILKGGYDTADSRGLFGRKSGES